MSTRTILRLAVIAGVVLLAPAATLAQRAPAKRPVAARADSQPPPFAIAPLTDDAVDVALTQGFTGRVPEALLLGLFTPGAGYERCPWFDAPPICTIGVILHGPRYVIARRAADAAAQGRRIDFAQERDRVQTAAAFVWITVAVATSSADSLTPDQRDRVVLQSHAGSGLGRARVVDPFTFEMFDHLVPPKFRTRSWRVQSYGFRPTDIPRDDFDIVVRAGGRELRIEVPAADQYYAGQYVR
jgi:hypothetical protein